MPQIRVVRHENGWKILEDGDDTGELYETEERAAEAARSRARDTGGSAEVVTGGGEAPD